MKKQVDGGERKKKDAQPVRHNGSGGVSAAQAHHAVRGATRWQISQMADHENNYSRTQLNFRQCFVDLMDLGSSNFYICWGC